MPKSATQNTQTILSNQPNYQSPITAAMNALTDFTNFGNLSDHETSKSYHSRIYSSESMENAQESASINSPPVNQSPHIPSLQYNRPT